MNSQPSPGLPMRSLHQPFVTHVRECAGASDLHFLRPVDLSGAPDADRARVVAALEVLELAGVIYRVETADSYDPTEFVVEWFFNTIP